MDAFYVAQSPERDVVTSILQEVENKYRLDAGEINLQVPEMLLRDCQQELQRVWSDPSNDVLFMEVILLF